MAEPIVLNTIERIGRALFAALTPATGARAFGSVTVSAGPEPVIISPNTYLIPVVGGQLRDDLLFKTDRNPELPRGAEEPGDWAIDAFQDGSVGIKSNVGGVRHNLPAGTLFRFNPPIEGLPLTATLEADMTDGSDDRQLIKRVAFFEDLDSASPSNDIFASKIGDRGVMLVWAQSEPVEGAISSLRQGANRGSRQRRFWRESFVLYVVVSNLLGDGTRRQDGLVIVQAITRLLTDRLQNDDGEQLSTVGSGVEITDRSRLGRSAHHYIYGIRLRVNQTLEATLDGRTFSPWLRTAYRGALPGREDPEPIEDLVIVDANDSMP